MCSLCDFNGIDWLKKSSHYLIILALLKLLLVKQIAFNLNITIDPNYIFCLYIGIYASFNQ